MSIAFHQNILLPPAMYPNQFTSDHVTQASHGLPQCLSYPTYVQPVTCNRTPSTEQHGYAYEYKTDTRRRESLVYSTSTDSELSEDNSTNMTPEHKVGQSWTQDNRVGISSGDQGDIIQASSLQPSSPHRLHLPNISASDNFAENVMCEESDLGYYSFCDVNDIKLEDCVLPTDLHGTQTSFSNIIDDVLDSLDEQVFMANHTKEQENSMGQERCLLNTIQNNQAQFIPNAFQNVIFNLQSPPPDVTQVSSSQGERQNPRLYCNVCNKSFKTKQEMAVHVQFHKDNRPHKCPYCKKGFTQKSTLRTHVRTHTGEKPFSCLYCSRAFSDYSTYRKHVRIHTGEKPYVCDVCKKSFTQSGNMIRHREIHFKKN